MNNERLIGIALGVAVFAMIDVKTWWDSPKGEDGKRAPFNIFVAFPKWVVGALAGGEVAVAA